MAVLAYFILTVHQKWYFTVAEVQWAESPENCIAELYLPVSVGSTLSKRRVVMGVPILLTRILQVNKDNLLIYIPQLSQRMLVSDHSGTYVSFKDFPL